MKKMMFVTIVVLLISVLSVSAFAETYKEYSYKCRTATTGSVILYEIDTAEDGTKTTRQIGSLSSGTYIHVTGYDYDLSMYRIGYYSNGSGQRAFIAGDAPIRSADVRVFFTDGTDDFIPEAVYNDPAELQSYLKRLLPGKKLNGNGRTPASIDGTLPQEQQDDPATPTHSPVKDPSTDTSGYVQGEWTASTDLSEEEQAFNASCPSRLKRTIWGYSDPHMTKKYEKINIGTYCDIVTDFNDVVKIAYYKNGVKHTAHIEKADLLGNYSVYIDDNGDSQTIYAGDPNYEATIAGHEVTWTAEAITQGLDDQVAAEQNSDGKPENSTSRKVTVNTIGVATSTVRYGDETIEVQSSQLSFSANVPQDKAVAVIHAPKSGKCSLHKTSSNSSKVLKKCKAGTVVVVLEYGSDKCKINYNGTVGYVATNCLKFYGTDVKTEGTGTLTYKGKATGKTTINVHNTPDKGSATIADWKTGTQVAVFGHDNGWYEIEYKGMHGYVMDKYLTVE